MPSTTDTHHRVLFYGFRSVTHARKFLCLCVRLGYIPNVVFTASKTGNMVVALGAEMPDLYIRIRSLKLGLLDWTVVPDMMARGLKARAGRAFRNHASCPAAKHFTIDAPIPTPAQ